NRVGQAAIVPVLGAVRTRYGFQTLEPFLEGTRWKLRGVINPPFIATTDKESGTATAAATATTPTTIPYNIGDMFKTLYAEGMWVATVTAKSATHIGYRFLDTRKGSRTVTVEAFAASIAGGEVQTY